MTNPTPDPAFDNAADAVESALVAHLNKVGDLDQEFLEHTIVQLRGLAIMATDADWGAGVEED